MNMEQNERFKIEESLRSLPREQREYLQDLIRNGLQNISNALELDRSSEAMHGIRYLDVELRRIGL